MAFETLNSDNIRFNICKIGYVSPYKIKDYVAESFGVTIEDIESKSRKREYVVPRHTAMFLIKECTNYPLKRIGSFFNNRDHSTVIHANNVCENLIDTDLRYNLKVESITNGILKEIEKDNKTFAN